MRYQPAAPSASESQLLEDAFHNLKYAMAEVFGRVADCLCSSQLPSQQTVNALDRELRDLENNAPPWLKFGEWATFPGEKKTIPQRHMVALLKDKALLGKLVQNSHTETLCLSLFVSSGIIANDITTSALHRPFFAKALKNLPEPLSGSYAASFIACISAARRHTLVMQSILDACKFEPVFLLPFPSSPSRVLSTPFNTNVGSCHRSDGSV